MITLKTYHNIKSSLASIVVSRNLKKGKSILCKTLLVKGDLQINSHTMGKSMKKEFVVVEETLETLAFLVLAVE